MDYTVEDLNDLRKIRDELCRELLEEPNLSIIGNGYNNDL